MNIEKKYMEEALAEARKALCRDEVPVGAVVVRESAIVARAHNESESRGDPTLHAEMLAMKRASEALDTRYLEDCVLYVTLEPCPMCAGACLSFRIGAVAFGAYDARAGALGSVTDIGSGVFGREIPVVGGVMRGECAELLSDYFKSKRPHGS